MIKNYQKRNQNRQTIIRVLASLLLATGLVVLIYYLTLPGKPINLLFVTEALSSTITPSPISTSTATKEPKPSQIPSAGSVHHRG